MTNSSSYSTWYLQTSTQEERLQIEPVENMWQRLLTAWGQKWLSLSLQPLAWLLLYLLPPLLLAISEASLSVFFLNAFSAGRALPFLLLIGFFYWNYMHLIPRLYFRKAFLFYFSLILASLLIIVLAGILLQRFPVGSSNNAPTGLTDLNYTALLFILLTTGSIYQQGQVTTLKKQIQTLDLALLNTRINPHFLFNSLNWIYSLAIESSKETPDALILLSGMMRYLVKDAGTQAVELKKELDYINNYVALQKGKLGHTIFVSCTVPAYTGTCSIAPLLLMSFIENAFKYGVNPEEDSAINIDISMTGNRLFLQIINNKVTTLYSTMNTGIGIENAKQRLQLLYPGLHQLDIIDDYKIYSVKLSIVL